MHSHVQPSHSFLSQLRKLNLKWFRSWAVCARVHRYFSWLVAGLVFAGVCRYFSCWAGAIHCGHKNGVWGTMVHFVKFQIVDLQNLAEYCATLVNLEEPCRTECMRSCMCGNSCKSIAWLCSVQLCSKSGKVGAYRCRSTVDNIAVVFVVILVKFDILMMRWAGSSFLPKLTTDLLWEISVGRKT